MATHSYRETLKQPGFQPFLWTQFLGAFNDNLFKIVVSMLAVHLVAAGSRGPRAVDRRARCSSCRSCSSPATRDSSPTSTASARCSSSASRSRSSRRRSALSRSRSATSQLTYAVLFLIALQATFFSPAKYGILPEMLPDRDLSRANGVLEMSTFVAIVARHGGRRLPVRSAARASLADRRAGGRRRRRRNGLELRHPARARAPPRPQTIDPNPWGEIWTGVKTLRRDRVLWLTVLGISYFWFLGSLLQLVVILFGTETMKLTDTWVGVLTAFAAIGIGAGSLAAGRLSGDKVELGLAPIGAIGMGVFAIALVTFRSLVHARGDQPDDRRVLRRPFRRAAERAAAAKERRRRKRAA